MGRLALIAALFVGCFTATPPDCIVQCGDEGQCPSGMSCLEDGFCHHPGTSVCRLPTDPQPAPDAAVVEFDAGEEDAGFWSPHCDGGWCRLHPPYEGRPASVFEARPGRFLACADGVYRWLPGGWVRVLDVQDARFLAGRSASDLRVLTSTHQFRFDGGWYSERLSFEPAAVTQTEAETLVFATNGSLFSSTTGPFSQVRQSTSFARDSIWSSGRPILLSRQQVASRSGSGSPWTLSALSQSLNAGSAAAVSSTLFIFSSQGTFTTPVSTLSSNRVTPNNQSQGALAGAVAGQAVLGIDVARLVEVKERSTVVVAQLPAELRTELSNTFVFYYPDGGSSVAVFGGSSPALWVGFNSKLWELTSSGGASRGPVTSQIVTGGFQDEHSTSFVAGGRVFEVELGLATLQPDSPNAITQLLPFEEGQAALTSTGLYLRSDAGWYLELPGQLVSGAANAGRLVARMRDGGVLLYSEGIPRVLEMPVPAVSVAVTQSGRIFAASDAGDIFVEDGGLFSRATALPAGARNLVPAPGDDLAYLRGLQLCWLDANTCNPGVPVDSTSQLIPLGAGAFAMIGSFPRAYVVTSPTSFDMVRLPLTPVSIWSGRDGGLFVGGAEGRVFQAQ